MKFEPTTRGKTESQRLCFYSTRLFDKMRANYQNHIHFTGHSMEITEMQDVSRDTFSAGQLEKRLACPTKWETSDRINLDPKC